MSTNINITKLYPFPSHVSVQSFVTVKLSDKSMYHLWETQMRYLLESHDLLGFINENIPVMQDGTDEHELWMKSNALVRGWILASLSEQAAIIVLDRLESKPDHQQTHVTAKHIWDQVQSTYGQHTELEEERKEGRAGCHSSVMQELYDAIECGKLKEVKSILENNNIRITDSISINDNTILHIAAAYSRGSSDGRDEFLKEMLDLNVNNIPLKDIKNSDGSTPLHLAASIGNANAANILLGKSRDLLYEKDNKGCTPVHVILSRRLNKEMHLLFESKILPDIDIDIEEACHTPLVVNAISNRHFDLALILIKKFKNSLKGPVVLTAIAQHCQADFTTNQLIIYELLWTKTVLELITRGTSDMKACKKLAYLVVAAGFAYPYKMLIQICMKLPVFENLKRIMKERKDARDLLEAVCEMIRSSNKGHSYRQFYTEAMVEAIKRDASDVVEKIVFSFPEAALILDEDGHNLAQAVWKNRASKIYALILDGHSLAKHTSLSFEPNLNKSGNNFLHYAARLGPVRKLDAVSCPPFRMHREIQWFKVAQELVPQWNMEKNCLGETPEMVFANEHKALVTESGVWINKVANSVAVTATLILTGLFAAAIQVPGGNNDNGLPNLISHPTFILFEISIEISGAACCLSLLLFLSVQTSPLTQDDFLRRLPLSLVVGWVSLFVSVSLSTFAFGDALFLIFWSNDPWVLGLVAPLTALPITSFFLIYSWSISIALADFLHSTRHFMVLHGFNRLRLVGRIFI